MNVEVDVFSAVVGWDTVQHVLGITMPIIRGPSYCCYSLWFPYGCGGRCVLSRGRLRTHLPTLPYGNRQLQRQYDGLLMMGIVMPKTCWAVSQQTTAENTSTSTSIRKPEAATAVWRAPDDGHSNVRNMLSSVCTTK
jgi:hypothetical protein